MRYALRPCSGEHRCPWRLDSEPGDFPPERYEALRTTSRRPDPNGKGDTDAQLGDPLFACHAPADGKEIACAGWLAVEGWGHVRVRIAVLTGEIPECALRPGEDWPELVGSYAQLATRNGARLPE